MSGKQQKKKRNGEAQRAVAEEIVDERAALRPTPRERQNVRHMRRLFGGQTTAEEYHSAALAARGHRCMICGGPPLITYRSMATRADLEREAPQYLVAIAESNPHGPYVPTFPSKHGAMVIISSAHACKPCEKRADHVAAQHPSWMTVEINRGPGADKPIVGVA